LPHDIDAMGIHIAAVHAVCEARFGPLIEIVDQCSVMVFKKRQAR
jgi:hypothetical protein